MTPTVVLFRPQNVINIAVVVRAMRNFGAQHLRLVAPEEWDPRRVEGIAHKTGDVIARTKIFDDLDGALADLTRVYGLTARGRTVKRNVQLATDAATEIVSAPPENKIAVMFGPEDKGLTNRELDRCHRVVTIPTTPEHSSLNLAQAVTVMLYEVFRETDRAAPLKPPRRDAPPASREQLEELFGSAERALEAIEFFKSHRSTSIMRALREMVHRTPLDTNEVGLLQAISFETVHFLKRKGVREL